jgi:hypothetical protein
MAVAVRLFSICACALVALGFVLFAADQAGDGSRHQVNLVGGVESPTPTDHSERRREREQGPLREAIDDANDVLLSPFGGVIGSRDIWAQRIVPAGFALLVYGLGLALLANALPRPRPR